MRPLPAYGCVLYWLKRLSTAPLRVWRFRDDAQQGRYALWGCLHSAAPAPKTGEADPCNEAYLSDEGYLVHAATRPWVAHGGFAAASLAAERGAGYLRRVGARLAA